MTIERKVGMGIAGQPTGGAVNVADVFSTYLYTGTDATHVINNGIDLAGEGGLVWTKARHVSYGHRLVDSESTLSSNKYLMTDTTSGAYSGPLVSSFNSNGFTLPANWYANTADTTYGGDYASWTFRKAPKFFDVVTWTGNSVANRKIAHNLGGDVGTMFIKRLDGARDWSVFHRSVGPTKILKLNLTNASATDDWIKNTAPSSTEINLGDDSRTNSSGQTYVAYLFADNTAEDADEQMIKCGSYTGNGLADSVVASLGWEPQFMLVKRTNAASDWIMVDSMRGAVAGGTVNNLYANGTSGTAVAGSVAPSSEGMRTGYNGDWGESNASGGNYIYMAIRAPMMKKPESGTEVFTPFQVPDPTSTGTVTPHVVDMGFIADRSGSDKFHIGSRLTGLERMNTTSTAAGSANSNQIWDRMNGYWNSAINGYMSWNFKRAKGFFDVVAYTGNGTARTIAHSLGVAPELLIVKRRSSTRDWNVYAAPLGNNKIRELNTAESFITSSSWNNTTPTASVFSVSGGSDNNNNGQTHIAYMWASVAGVSKVGSYTGNGSSQTLNCGFAAGARFVLIKRTDASGDWYIWDTTRGIVAGNDPHLSLNTTAAEVTSDDSVDPDNSGFIVNQVAATNINVSSGTYIFLAIA